MDSFIGYYDVNFFCIIVVVNVNFRPVLPRLDPRLSSTRTTTKDNLYYIHLEKKMLNLVIANSKTRKKRGYIVITIDISATPYSPLKLLLKQFFNSHLSASPLSLLQRHPQTSSICG